MHRPQDFVGHRAWPGDHQELTPRSNDHVILPLPTVDAYARTWRLFGKALPWPIPSDVSLPALTVIGADPSSALFCDADHQYPACLVLTLIAAQTFFVHAGPRLLHNRSRYAAVGSANSC